MGAYLKIYLIDFQRPISTKKCISVFWHWPLLPQIHDLKKTSETSLIWSTINEKGAKPGMLIK